MKYAVDRIEDNIAVLENIETGELLEIRLNEIDDEIQETDILLFEDGKFIKDNEAKEERIMTLEEKFNMVKNIKKEDDED